MPKSEAVVEMVVNIKYYWSKPGFSFRKIITNKSRFCKECIVKPCCSEPCIDVLKEVKERYKKFGIV